MLRPLYHPAFAGRSSKALLFPFKLRSWLQMLLPPLPGPASLAHLLAPYTLMEQPPHAAP